MEKLTICHEELFQGNERNMRMIVNKENASKFE